MPRRKTPPTAARELSGPATIGFRLDEASLRVLSHRAARLKVSRHELARHYVEELLHEPEERAALRAAVEALHHHLHEFRRDFSVAVEALLTSAGKVSEEEARKWTADGLHPD